jgi:hypothetical protein
MHNRIKTLLILFVLLLTISCKKEKTFTVHNCADNIEASKDILRSVKLNRDYLQKNNITIIEEDNKCGFTFKYRERSKYIEGSMTDIDLMMEIKSFYNIKN